MKKVWSSLVAFIFSVCLIAGTVAPASAAAMKKVTNFKAAATPVAVTLTWSKASGAKGYEIQQKSGKKWKKVATIKKQKTTTYTVKKLKNGTSYQFRIYAVNGKKKSKATTVKVKTGVQKITGVMAVSTGLKSAKLTWTKGNVTGYEIQRKVGKKWKNVKTIKKAKTTSVTVSNIAAGQNNSFRIRGYVSANAKKYYGAYTTVNVTTAVAPMKNVSVKSVTDSAVAIGWSKVSGVSGYQVQKYQGNRWVDVNTAVKNNVTQYTVSGLSAFANQQLRVRAYQKDGGKTYYNNWAVINAKTNMGNASGVYYSGLSFNWVNLHWNGANGAAGYRVFNNGVKIADVKTNYAGISINPGTTYRITVAPYNGGTVGNATSAITFTSPCAKVTGLRLTGINDTAVTVVWSAAAGAQSYQLQYSKDGSNWSTVNLGSTSYTISGLSANTEYQVRVCAINKNGNITQYGQFSDVLRERTTGCTAVSGTNGATIYWKNISGATSYGVEYYDVDTNSWTGKGTVNSTEFSVADFEGKSAGLYRVVARDSSGKVIYTSDGITAAAAGYSVVKNGHNVTVSWPSTGDATSYRVVRFTQENAEDIKTVAASARSVSMNIAPGLIHEYKIIAVIGGRDVTIANFAVEAAKIDLNDKSDSAVNAQLLYLTEAVNRSKYDYTHKTYIDTTLDMINNINYMEFGIMDLGMAAGAVDLALWFAFNGTLKGNYEIDGGYIKCYDQAAVNSLFGAIGEAGDDSQVTEITRATFNKSRTGFVQYRQPDGTYAESKSTVLDQVIQPANTLNQFAEIYNSNNASAWKNGFESVNMTKTNDGYKIVAVLKKENTDSVKGTEPVYHAGLVNAVSGGNINLGMEGGQSTVKSVMGKTTLIAEIDSECRLKSYEIDMPYTMDMNIVLPFNIADMSGELADILGDRDAVKIEVSMNMSGSQHSNSVFTRTK